MTAVDVLRWSNGGQPCEWLDRIVLSPEHRAWVRERVDEEPGQDAAAAARAPRRPVEDAVGVHEPPLLRAVDDAQGAFTALTARV